MQEYKKKIYTVVLATVMTVCLVSGDFLNNEVTDELARANSRRQIGLRFRTPLKRCDKCPVNTCRVLGMQRYAEPTCEPLGGLGATCRMYQEPENKTLHYPSFMLRCNDVYLQFCPCAAGLVCEETECRPAPSTNNWFTNSGLDDARVLKMDEEEDNLPTIESNHNRGGQATPIYETPDLHQSFGGGGAGSSGATGPFRVDENFVPSILANRNQEEAVERDSFDMPSRSRQFQWPGTRVAEWDVQVGN